MTYAYQPPELRRRLHFDQIVSKSYWSWRTNPSIMVPTMISSSIAVLTQSIFVIFATAFLIQLESNGTLSQINSEISTGNTSAIVGLLLSPSVFYDLFGILTAAFLIFRNCLNSRGRRHLLIRIHVLSSRNPGRASENRNSGIGPQGKMEKDGVDPFPSPVFTYLPVAALSSLGLFIAFSSGFQFASLLLLLGLFIVGLIPTAIMVFLFTYSLPAVAFDDLSGIAALRKSYHVATENVGITATYALVRVMSYLIITVIASLVSTLGLPLTSIASIAVTLFLVPVLHLAKATIYVEAPKRSAMQFEIYGPTSASKDLFGGPFFRFAFRKLKQGIVELKNFSFNPYNLPFHIGAALALLLGVWIGLYIGKNGLDATILGLGYAPGRINPTILSAVPLSEGFDIFLHNWLVSLSTALSGLWLVAPSLATLAFNGIVLGAVYYLTPSFTMFAAAIFPHGIIEIPSFVLAGSAGTRLGYAFFKTFGREKNSLEEARFEQIATQTIYVLIGIAVLFFIAGFIEGNITPIIMRMYGWH